MYNPFVFYVDIAQISGRIVRRKPPYQDGADNIGKVIGMTTRNTALLYLVEHKNSLREWFVDHCEFINES